MQQGDFLVESKYAELRIVQTQTQTQTKFIQHK